MKAVVAWLLARIPWADFILVIVKAVSERMSAIWGAVYECVVWVQENHPDEAPRAKLELARQCIAQKLSAMGIVAKESIINLLIELAVQLLKVRR